MCAIVKIQDVHENGNYGKNSKHHGGLPLLHGLKKVIIVTIINILQQQKQPKCCSHGKLNFALETQENK